MLSPTALGWTFVGAQAVLLGALVLLPGADDWTNASVIANGARGVEFGGLILVVAAALGLGSALTPTPMPKVNAGLRTSGLYRFVRHPILGRAAFRRRRGRRVRQHRQDRAWHGDDRVLQRESSLGRASAQLRLPRLQRLRRPHPTLRPPSAVPPSVTAIAAESAFRPRQRTW